MTTLRPTLRRPFSLPARVAAIVCLAFATACDPELVPPPNPGTATASGRVVGLDGRPVAGATVSPAQGDATRTDSLGLFTLTGVRPSDRLAVNVASASFVSTTVVYPVYPGRETFRIVSLIPRAQAQPVNAERGGEVPLGRGGSVRLEPGSLVDAGGQPARGEVLVRATYIDPTDTTQVLAAPGDYLSTVRAGAGAPLETLGMVEINVTDRAGRELRLADNRSATVRWPRTSEPARGAFFAFDRRSGLWDRRGDIDVGGTPVFTIDEISNWDIDFPVVCIRVHAGAPGVRVIAQGLDYSSATDGWTDASGFAILGVRASSSVKLGVHPAQALATNTFSTPAGPIIPPTTPFGTQQERLAACPGPIANGGTLTIRPDWIANRRIDAVIAR
ncbi:MAG TPA: carboxypeptidase-like regulatory domain-containing protein [Longimicrobium sp.]|nr:carboxypeptidase-like regulatory domain-containing protein [Longimicrobium sp.]